MNCFDLTLPTPRHQLAADEVLLDLCEEGRSEPVLSFWEPREYFIVVGYANPVAREVNVPACEADRVPILRRCSGGGTVLQGPGCLNYALVLRITEDGPLQTIPGANRWIMARNGAAIATALGQPVEVRGHTDLTLAGLKFSGNAQRRRRDFLLFHGCFLLHLDVARIERYLPMPSHEPDYRQGRSHTRFLTNLNIPAELVRQTLRHAWAAAPSSAPAGLDAIETLAAGKYSTREWNWKF